MYRPNSDEAALLVLRAVDAYASTTDKVITRALFTQKAMRRLLCRKRLDSRFVEEVTVALLDYGWILFQSTNSFALVAERSVERWNKIWPKLIAEDLRAARKGRFDFALEAERRSSVEDEEDED